MTIDEAIKHCEEEAEKYMEYGIETECYQCGKEHEQLAEWLRELKEAKRLLKLALQDLAEADHCGLCKHEPDNIATCQRKPINCFVWRYADEAEKLLKEG